ncbi:MAG TPA: protein kinase [Bryobacteraceae bacterium]|nr:protein kinase [Bryobacteraceae bacterium]
MDRIGKFEITGELGAGGFGKVYKALDPSVGRVVAIKVLNVQEDPVMVKRFRAEATTSARLQHKNIVTIHQFGEDRGKQYLVMEYLDGRSLLQLIRDKTPIPLLEKLEIMSEVAQGLHYAHLHDVVHRDVKPANIMWLSDGGVKVMDFGIARMMHNTGTRLTQTGSMIGTLQYMAPEQFTSETVDARCDIWAYGVVLHEFITGTNPFDAGNPLQVMFLVTRGEVSFTIPEHPAGLAPLLKRLLSRSLEERYPTMEDAGFDLEQVILDLKHNEVGSLSESAAKLIQEERFIEALSVVRQILDFDQSHEFARKWRKELTDRIKQQSVQVRVKELAGQAESLVSTRDLAGAADRLEEALRLDANNSAVRVRLQEIRAQQDSIRRAVALVAEARLELQHEALTSAFEHASQAAEADPGNQEAGALLEQVKSLVERRESEIQRRGTLSKAKGLVLVQDYAGATRLLEAWAAQHPGDPEIQERLAEANRLHAATAAQGRINAAMIEAKEMIRRGSYGRAIEILQSISPGSPEIAALLTYAREQGEAESVAARRREEEARSILRQVADCRALLQAGNLEQAAARSAELDARYPADASVAELREEMAHRVREWRERRRKAAASLIEQGRANAVRETIAEIEGLIARGEFPQALEASNAAMGRFPTEPRFAELRLQAQPAPPRRVAETGGSAVRPPVPRQGLDRRVVIAIGVCILLSAAVAGVFLMRGGGGSSASPPTTAPDLPGPVLPPVPTAKGAADNPKDGARKELVEKADPHKEPAKSAAAANTTEPAPTEGTIVWTGDLDSGQEIDLGSSSAPGSLAGRLPGVPVNVEVHPSSVRVVTPPGEQNGWSHMVLHNDGKKQVMILVKWAVR